MAITEVSSAVATSVGSQPSITIPSTTVEANDFIVAWASVGGNSTPDVSGPAGYTNVCAASANGGFNASEHLVVYKVAVGGEEDDVLSFTTEFNYANLTGVVVFRGVDTSTPFDVTVVHGTHHIAGTDDSTPTAANITTVTADTIVVVLSMLRDIDNTVTSVSTDASGETELQNVVDIAGHLSGLVTYEEIASAGLWSGDTHTYAAAHANADSHMLAFALRPEAAASTVHIPVRRRYW